MGGRDVCAEIRYLGAARFDLGKYSGGLGR